MAKASIQPIYDRMNSVENYHPFTADTYADWSLEAGDIVTVSRDGKSLTGPVHNATVRWTGKQKVSLESRGEKERGSIAKMSARAFNSGGNGGGAYRSGYGGRQKTNADIQISKNEIVAYVDDEDDKLGARIDVQAGRIDIVVTKDGKVKAGVVVDAINADSSVTILASRIKLEGDVNLNSVVYVSSGVAIFKVPISVSGGTTPVQIQNGAVTASNIRIRSGGVPWDLKIADASVDGNVLTITKVGGEKINFSKATTLSGKWSSATKTYTVTAKQDTEVVGENKTKIHSIQNVRDLTPIGNNVGKEVSVYATENGGSSGVYTGFTSEIWIDAQDIYDKGYKVTSSQVSGSASGTVPQSSGTGPISGRRNLGRVSLPSVASYALITVSVHGYSVDCYLTIG